MKLGFSMTARCGGKDFAGALRAAERMGFDGVGLAWDGSEAGSRSELLEAVEKIRRCKEEHGHKVAVSSIATEASLHHANESDWKRAADDVRFALGMARDAGADVVRVFGFSVGRGEGRSAVITRIAKRLRELAEMSREITGGRVSVALQNGGSFVNARELWTIIEAAGQTDGAGVGWDVGEALLHGGTETPGLAVTTLNSRIHLARVWDHHGTHAPVELGTGIVQVKTFVQRLRGIGYEGWLIYAPPTAPSIGDDTHLEIAIGRLKEWLGMRTPEPALVAAAKGTH